MDEMKTYTDEFIAKVGTVDLNDHAAVEALLTEIDCECPECARLVADLRKAMYGAIQ